jgi:hypothetical protein
MRRLGNYRAFAQVRLAELANPVESSNIRVRRQALYAVIRISARNPGLQAGEG